MTSTDDLRASGHALLRLAEFLDRNAPGLLPDNEDAIYATPALLLHTDDAAMLLSYEAALREFLPSPTRGISHADPSLAYTHQLNDALSFYLTGPAPERITDDRS